MMNERTLEKLEYQKVLTYISKYCATESGKDLVSGLKPFNSLEAVTEAGKFVDEAKDILIHNDFPPLGYIPNLYEIIAKSRIPGSILSQKNILDILNSAETSRKLKGFLLTREPDYTLKKEFAELLFSDKNFENSIRKIFNEAGEIADHASVKLREVRNETREKKAQLNKVVTHLLKQFSDDFLVREEYVTQREGRIVVPIKAEHKRHIKGFIHSESASGQTVYIEPEQTLELNNDILSLSFAEKREIERILRSLTARIAQESDDLKTSLKIIAELDAIFAKAKYSIEIIGAFPSFDEKRGIELMDARHPILIKKIGRENTIPLSLEIRDQNIIVITGPNAGGKTVVLKTTGLIYMMALSGIHIPANPDSNLLFLENILVDIGDQQSIEDDLSTFSSHLSNIKSILEIADVNTLVLLDEIGTGTDPAEGSALATAILISLYNLSAKVLATTHHGNLKVIANDFEGFQNASMEFNKENLTPTYRFKQGFPGSSYAFEVAERIGFRKEFIDLAKEHLDTDKTKMEEFLTDLEFRSNDLRTKLNRSEIENTRLQGLTNLYQEKISELEKQKREILKDAQKKAEVYLKDINKKVESAIKTIKESNADKKIVKEEREKIAGIKKTNEEIAVKEKKEVIKKRDLKEGDYASIKNTSTSGVITKINIEKNKALLAVGSIKLQVKLSDLIPAKKADAENKPSPGLSYTPEPQSLRLDIRGKKPEEIDFEVMRFVDEAYASNVNEVEILHGKGTGALKRTVHEVLKSHEHVKNFDFAKIEFGGEGVTIVELN